MKADLLALSLYAIQAFANYAQPSFSVGTVGNHSLVCSTMHRC